MSFMIYNNNNQSKFIKKCNIINIMNYFSSVFEHIISYYDYNHIKIFISPPHFLQTHS